MNVPMDFPHSNNGRELVVTSPGSYPPLEVERPHFPYARMLMQDLSSSHSEMTAIYQYLYQDWIIADQVPELASALRKIAQVEMHHLDILGRMIVLLGGDPRCQAMPNNRRSAWNGNNLTYTHTVVSFLKSNITAEQFARNTYLAQANMVQDPKVSAVLRKLAADEDVHIGIFRRFLSELENS